MMKNVPAILGLIAFYLLQTTAGAQHAARGKCGTAERIRTLTMSSVSGKMAVESVRPMLQTSILSPSKHFRIHFDTIGTNTPALVTATGERIEGTARAYADSTGRIFDAVWETEIDRFGFPPPATDEGRGGGDEYDVYIENLGVPEFGSTTPDYDDPVSGSGAGSCFHAYTEIDHDLGRGYRTMGLSAVRVTAAHEFFHAIQMSRYRLWNVEEWYFYELSAEAMEQAVFPVVKDYINDIPLYFNDPSSIPLFDSYADGYERAIWGIFLMQRCGVSIMREIWEHAASMRPCLAVRAALEKHGTTLEREFSEFCYWNYFTGWRADTARYYPDAPLFPVVRMKDRASLGSSQTTLQNACTPFSAGYLQAASGQDTAAFITANVNTAEAFAGSQKMSGYSLTVSLSMIEGGFQLRNGWSARFSAPDPIHWGTAVVCAAGSKLRPATDGIACFPNPFHPGASSFLIAAQNLPAAKHSVRLMIYSSAGSLVFTGDAPVEQFNGVPYLVWEGRTTDGMLPASGVYVYVFDVSGSMVKGKFAVVR